MSFFATLTVGGRYGWGIAELKPWELSWIGGSAIPFAYGAMNTITLAYGTHCKLTRLTVTVVDCYYPVTAEVMQLSVSVRNLVGFGFSYAITPWY
jgi:hypothetical protein